MRAKSKAVTNYWLEYYINPATGLCNLCANTVLPPTNAICICPNGQEIRKATT